MDFTKKRIKINQSSYLCFYCYYLEYLPRFEEERWSKYVADGIGMKKMKTDSKDCYLCNDRDESKTSLGKFY